MAVIRAALIGHPVAHSLSPALHAAAAKACGVELRYDLVDTPPRAVSDTVERLRRTGYAGFNVTAPHKRAVAERVDTLSEAARAIGAVNTVVFGPDGLAGHNTDAFGLRRALADVRAPAGRAVVLGAGGAASAAVHALRERPLTVIARRVEEAAALHSKAAPWESLGAELEGAALLVNCTARRAAPVIAALPFDRLAPGACVFDMNYGVAARPVADAVARAGYRHADGLGMLAWQGLRAFELWTGRRPSVDPVLAALRAASP